jgi:hypothetical protein
MCFLPQSKIGNRKSKMSSYDPIRPHQHVRWNRQADLLGGVEIDELIQTSSVVPLEDRRAWFPLGFCPQKPRRA